MPARSQRSEQVMPSCGSCSPGHTPMCSRCTYKRGAELDKHIHDLDVEIPLIHSTADRLELEQVRQEYLEERARIRNDQAKK